MKDETAACLLYACNSILVTVLIILFAGDPDLMDAVIGYLNK